jgi:flavodoxin
MRALVVYDSQYGNTAQIAQAVADGLRAAGASEVELRKVDAVKPDQLPVIDILVVGSPTQGFRSMPTVRDFLKGIPKKALAGVRVAGFDTRLTGEELHSHGPVLGKMVDWFGYAAPDISEALEKKGGQVAAPSEGFFVGGTEGPLLEGELARANEWARQIAARSQQ